MTQEQGTSQNLLSRRRLLQIGALTPVAALIIACTKEEKLPEAKKPQPQKEKRAFLTPDENAIDLIYTVWDVVNEDFHGKLSRWAIDQETMSQIKQSLIKNDTFRNSPQISISLEKETLSHHSGSLNIQVQYDQNGCVIMQRIQGRFMLEQIPRLQELFQGQKYPAEEKIFEASKILFIIPEWATQKPLIIDQKSKELLMVFSGSDSTQSFQLFMDQSGHFSVQISDNSCS